MGNKNFLIILTFIFTNICYCQFIDISLKKYEYDIFLQLKQYDSLALAKKNFKEAKNYIFASEVLKFNEDILFYKVGVTANHSFKYIGYTMNDKFILLPTKDFSLEFSNIIDILTTGTINSEIKSADIVSFFKNLHSVYLYNQDPPWKSRGVSNPTIK